MIVRRRNGADLRRKPRCRIRDCQYVLPSRLGRRGSLPAGQHGPRRLGSETMPSFVMRTFAVVVAAMLVSCSNSGVVENTGVIDDGGSGAAFTSTIPLPDGVEPGESTPEDHSNPATLTELEGLKMDEAERQARDRGWTTIERYTQAEYDSFSFDAVFIQTRLVIIYEPDSLLVLEATVG